MLPRSLRGELTLAFTALAALVVLAATTGMTIVLRHAVWAPLDAALEEEAEVVSLGADRTGLARAVARIGAEQDLGPRKFIRVEGPGGRLVAGSGRVPPGMEGAGPVPATIDAGRHAYRVLRRPAPEGRTIQIGVGVDRHVRMLRRATAAIGATAAVLLATLAFLAWIITSRATADLARLASELETVEAGSLDRRLVPRRTTEVDRLSAVLNRLLARLEDALGHLRRFTADAAHELRTPIAALRARIEVTLARARSADEYREGLVDALEQTERVGRLADDLLTLSAVEGGTIGAELVRLDSVAREVAEFLDPVAQEQGRRFACAADEPVTVAGSAELLKRLLLNLVDNAFSHTAPSAAVRLSVRADPDTATIEVRDEGAGIPTADLPRVFDRFHRGRTSARGAGLGLALCREIAAGHRGRIALGSTPGAGTTVTVTLPRASAA